MEIIRAEKTAQQAGAYYVRIQAMARKHHITLDQEFEEHEIVLCRISKMERTAFRIDLVALPCAVAR